MAGPLKREDHYKSCPECGKSWDAGRIWKVWRAMKGNKYYQSMTDEQLQEIEERCYSEPYHFSKLIGIEVSEKYDGVSYWQCPFCKSTWGRWSGELVEVNDDGEEGRNLSGTKGNAVGDKSIKN